MASVYGDERALAEEDKPYLTKKQALADPLAQDLFIEFTRPIFTQVTDFVGRYYREK